MTDQNIEQQIDEIIQQHRFEVEKLPPAEAFANAKVAILVLISQQVSEAIVQQLTLLKEYAVADDGDVYFIKINKRQLDVLETPPTPNGDEQGALANPSTPTAISKQADNQSEVA